MRSFALYIRVEISVPWNLQFLEAIHNKKLFYAWPWLVVVEGTRLEFKCILSQFHFSKERANWWEERVVAFSGNQEFLEEFRFFVGKKCKFLKICIVVFCFLRVKEWICLYSQTQSSPKFVFKVKVLTGNSLAIDTLSNSNAVWSKHLTFLISQVKKNKWCKTKHDKKKVDKRKESRMMFRDRP